jgi:hypothetical protein
MKLMKHAGTSELLDICPVAARGGTKTWTSRTFAAHIWLHAWLDRRYDPPNIFLSMSLSDACFKMINCNYDEHDPKSILPAHVEVPCSDYIRYYPFNIVKPW